MMKKVFLLGMLFFCSALPRTFAQENISKKATGGVCNGSASYLPEPDYPTADADVSGVVNVQVKVDESGNVESAIAISGHPLLRPNAEKAALKARFKSPVVDGKTVKYNCVLVYKFAPRESIVQKNPVVQPTDNYTEKKVNRPIVSCSICNSRVKYLSVPEYPDIAKKFHISGSVKVRIIIGNDGSVIKAKPISGHPFLLAESVKAARRAKFEPTVVGGKAIRVYGLLVYNFLPAK